MTQSLIDEDDLKSKGIKFSKAQRNRLIRGGKFPRPVRIGQRTNVWLESEVDAWLAEKIAERDAAGPAAA